MLASSFDGWVCFPLAEQLTGLCWSATKLAPNIQDALQKPAGPDQRATPASRLSAFEYRYLTEFQSHEPEFDYLKSLEIEEKINKVKWCRTSCGSRMLLSTNDKTIKLWRVCTCHDAYALV